jgi:hypothetical protein
MYSDIRLDYIYIIGNVMYLECMYNISSPKARNVMYACMTKI